MTIDDVTEVGDWFVAQGDHDGASRATFESEGETRWWVLKGTPLHLAY